MAHKARAVAVVLFAGIVIGRSPHMTAAQPCDFAATLDDIEQAMTELELSQAYATVLHRATAESVERFKAHSCTGLALQAAWADVKQFISAKRPSRDDSPGEETRKLPVVTTAKFIGFVEGRLRVSPPKWWKEDLSRARGSLDTDTGLLLLYIRQKKNLYSRVEGSRDDSVDLFTRGAISNVQASGETLSIECEHGSFEVPHTHRGPCHVFGKTVGTAQCIVLVHGQTPWGTLFCVDVKEDKVVWSQRLWCDAAPWVRSGAFTHASETRVRGDVVYVFGMCNDVVYIEGFRLADGKAEFRFSTTYGWTIPVANRTGAGPTD